MEMRIHADSKGKVDRDDIAQAYCCAKCHGNTIHVFIW